MTDVTFGHKESLYKAGETIDLVYFPRTGIISTVIVMDDGQTAGVAAIGREGMLGVSTFLGVGKSSEHVFCQINPAECRKLPVAEFVAEVVHSVAGNAAGRLEYLFGICERASSCKRLE